MTWRSRGALAAGLALLVVLFSGPAQSATAATTPPIDRASWTQLMQQRMYGSRVPGSVLGRSSANHTPIQRIAGVDRSVRATVASGAAGKGGVVIPTATTGKAAKFGAKLGGVSTAVSAAFGVDLFYGLFAGEYTDHFGFAGVTGYDSQGLACDLTAVFTGSGCMVALDPSVFPNEDVVIGSPGWENGVNVVQHTASKMSRVNVGYEVLSAPAFGTQGDIMIRAQVGSWVAGCSPDDSEIVLGNAFTWVAKNGVVRESGGGSVFIPPYVRHPNCTTGQAVDFLRRVDGAGYTFDHLVIKDGTDVVARWYPQGHALRPADTDPDPLRRWITTWRCDDGPEQTTTGDPWRETDPEWPAPLEPTCGDGSLTYVRVDEIADGLDPATLYEWELPAEVQQWARDFPQCASGSCILELQRVDVTTGTRLACFDEPAACLDWFTDPQKTTKYACTYGGVDLALDECNMYAPTFDPAKRGTDGAAYADPETGEEAGGTPLPPDDAATAGCPPAFEFTLGGMGYWVWKGASCAIASMFSPRPSVVAGSAAAITASVELSAIGPIQDSWDGLSNLDMSGSCGVLVEASPSVFQGEAFRIDTCAPFWSSWSTVRNIIGMGFLVGSVWAGSSVVLRSAGIYAGDRKDDDR